MMGMLAPVADHVREMQSQFGQLNKRFSVVSTTVEENRSQLDQQHADFVAVRECLVTMDSDVDKLRSDLAQVSREKQRLHNDHDVTKNDLAKVAGNLRTSNVVLKALQQKTEDLDGDVRTLEQGTQKMGRTLREQHEHIAQLKEYAENLNGRYTDTVRDLNMCVKAHGDLDTTLRNFMHGFENKDAASRAEMRRISETLQSVEERLGATQQHVLEAMDGLKLLDAGLRLIRSSLDHGEGSQRKVDQLYLWREKSSIALKEQSDNISKIEEALAQMANTAVSDKENTDHQFRDVEKRIKQQTSKIEKLGATVKSQDETDTKHESAIGRIERNMEALGEQADLMRADHLAIRSIQNEASNKIEGHRILLSKTQVDLQHAGAELGKTNNNLNNLKESLAEANVNVSKLGNRYDACTKNILGMSKGFHDMSRHMNQGEGLLPSKSPRKLPELKAPLLETVERGNSIGNSINRMSPTNRMEVSYGCSTPTSER
jgi:chromosome segregation ATPase